MIFYGSFVVYGLPELSAFAIVPFFIGGICCAKWVSDFIDWNFDEANAKNPINQAKIIHIHSIRNL
jgi:hypothetical protein